MTGTTKTSAPPGQRLTIDRDPRLEVDTPEHITLAFDLAGPGSRAMAAMIDYGLIASTLIALGLVVALAPAIEGAVGGVSAATWTFLAFLLQSGYFFTCEWIWRGRTVGKRAIGLRVVSDDGTPIDIEAAALRNVLRVIDLQPGFTGILGLGLMAGQRRSQRVGDLVAGTIVVRDLVTDEVPESAATATLEGRALLTPDQFGVLDQYIERRTTLTETARRRIAARVFEVLGPLRGVNQDLRERSMDDILGELHAAESRRQASGLNRQSIRLFAERREAWSEFDALVGRARDRGLRGFSPLEVERFTQLYREVTADLARARTYGASLRLQLALDRRVTAGHNIFYRDRRDSRAWTWVRGGLPRAVRANLGYVALAAGLLFIPAGIIYGVVRADPAKGPEWAGPVMTERAERGAIQLAEGGSYFEVPATTMPLFGAQITTNNLRVALTAVAGGALAGLGTVALLILNGVHLGSAFAVFDNAGAGPILWEWVLPHGVIELTAIVLAGAAGLLIGGALLNPGRRTRGDALRLRSSAVAGLMAAALFLLVIAGLIEGYISPSTLPTPIKMTFSAVFAGILLLYLWTGGRDEVREAPSP